MGIFGKPYNLDPAPSPPPLPKYDPAEDAPKWSWNRLLFGVPVDKGDVPFAKLGETADPDKPDWRGVIKNNVIEWKMPEPDKFGGPKLDHYFWFDTPDYADPFKKMWYATKWFTNSGFLIGFGYYGIGLQRKCTLANTAEMMRKITLPWIFAGLAASTTVLVLANLRGKKDDYYNYGLAGAAFGSIIGRKNHLTWTRQTILWTIAGLSLKYIAENNQSLACRFNFRSIHWTLSGNSADHGFASGDHTFGLNYIKEDPGRDLRTTF